MSDRARQFMPFSPLKGYYDLIEKCERIKEPKIELTEDMLEIISQKLNKIEKGIMIKVKYYDVDSYVEIEGMISNIDKIYNNLTVIKTVIKFEDIYVRSINSGLCSLFDSLFWCVSYIILLTVRTYMVKLSKESVIELGCYYE